MHRHYHLYVLACKKNDLYRPVVDRAFRALVEAVDPNGRLGWVQPIGQDPKLVKASDTDTYGVGAFLLAATQVAKLR